jgi:sugar phosphate permease
MKENPLLPPEATGFFRTSRGQVFYGWWVLLLGALITGIGVGVIYHSFTVFFLPLKRDLGVSSAAISLLFGAARLEGGIDGVLYGYFIDRFGSRKMIIIGSCLAGTGLILLSWVQSFFSFFLIYVFIVSVGQNAGFFHPVSSAVNKWFIRRRALGFSIITASGNIGGMIMAPLLSYVILASGWRTGAVLAGVLILAIAVPAAVPIRPSPESMGLPPDGQARPRKKEGPAKQVLHGGDEVDFTVREALRTLQFWMLAGAISLRILVTMALNTHFVPILVWNGISESASAYMVSLFALITIPMTLGLGWLGDRWKKSRLASLCALPMILVMIGMFLSRERLFIYFFPVAFALLMGTAPLNWALIGDFFGRSNYATLRGIMGIGYGTATFFSPVYAGWVFDRTESYALVLLTFAIILGIAAVLFAVLNPPGRPSSPVRLSS